MGHGICLTYNRQSPLSGPLGRATDDDKVIGGLSWKLLKLMNIPPNELRGLGIQIQKLESSAPPTMPAGQVRLSFKPVASPRKGETSTSKAFAITDPFEEFAPELDVQHTPGIILDFSATVRPHTDQLATDLPAFSQVDISVFNALPDDVRAELEAQYKHRSVTPAPREPSTPPDRPDLARITHQLAPRSRPLAGPAKGKVWFALPAKRAQAPPRATSSQLGALGIDVEVFRALPVNIQREQLAQARGLATRLSQRPARARRPLKAPMRLGERFRPPKGPHEFIPPPPPPAAKFVEPPTLRRPPVEKGGEKRTVVDGTEVQKMIGEWVDSFREHIPHRRDVEYFGRYLESCVENDLGVERAVGVVRWWGVLLRRLFGTWERVGEEEAGKLLDEWVDGRAIQQGEVTSEMVGRAWWRIFKEITMRMNAVARKRFGGSLAYK
jgi:DNA repair protein REV1